MRQRCWQGVDASTDAGKTLFELMRTSANNALTDRVQLTTRARYAERQQLP